MTNTYIKNCFPVVKDTDVLVLLGFDRDHN